LSDDSAFSVESECSHGAVKALGAQELVKMVSLSLVLVNDRPALVFLYKNCNPHKSSCHEREEESFEELLKVGVNKLFAEGA